MIPPPPSKILVGISLDPDHSIELLSWATRVLAQSNDTIVAIHVRVGEESKKGELIKKKQWQIRQAKAHVISVLGEFARTCQSKQINLEARLIIFFFVARETDQIELYCFEHAPETCTVLSLGKCEPQKNSANIRENLQPSSRWLNGNTRSGSTSSTIENHINSETERHNSSPRTVLHQLEAESHSTEDDTCSLGDLSTTESPPLATNINGHSKNQISTCKLISSIFASPMRKGNRIFLNKEKKQSTLLKCFTYEEIASATNNFHPDNIVGRCGYSEVYRANLLGCCVENGLYLIFNFSQNGNLASALRGKTGESLQWPVRYKIALGVARGPDYEPQITDFGLAKWLPNKVTHHAVIPIEGTFGYLAPEYFMHGIVDEKTDVFAFGVLLLEIITGRRPVDSTQQNLLLWAKPLMESGNITELADRPELEGKFDSDQVQRVVLTASYCVRQSSTWRPSMSEVLELLTSGHDSEVARSWRMPSAVARINAVKSGNSFYLFVIPFSVPFFH
ncbi:hypothetical protein OIU78_002574 [Salix suchowensis]|nr:hypothetical protein OIU78_002574 [Salix suchowensis]